MGWTENSLSRGHMGSGAMQKPDAALASDSEEPGIQESGINVSRCWRDLFSWTQTAAQFINRMWFKQ